MATAMVVTSLYAPQNAAAAGKNAMVIKGSKASIKTKNLFLTGQTVNLDAMVKGKLVKNKNLTWKSSDKSVVSVNKIGVIKAVKASDKPVYVSFTTKGKKKVTVKIAVTVCVRASKMMLTPSAVTVKAGEKAEVAATFELSEKVKAAKAEDTTYNVFAKSSDESVAKVSVDGRKIVVEGVAKSATPVTITVYSTQVKSLKAAEKAKIKLEEKFDVKVMSKLSAQQAGANKIKVMGTDLVASKSAYVIKNANGGILELKDEVKLNADKTEADLESITSQIPTGKYTLTYNNGDAVEFEVVKAVVNSIELVTSGVAIMSESGTEAYAYYKVLDQFGNDVTKSAAASRVTVNGSHSASGSMGKITFKADSTDATKKFQLNIDRVSVAIVDLNTGKSVNGFLTIGNKASMAEVKYEKLFNNSKREIVDSINDGDKLENFSILFSAVDQYGNEFDLDEGGKQLVVSVLGVTGVSVDQNKIKLIEYKNKKYYAYQLKNVDNSKETARAGEATIQAVVVNNGKTSSDKFNVVASSKIESLRIWEGNDGVYQGKINKLNFTAYDGKGKEVTAWSSFEELMKDNRFTTDTRFKFDREDGKIVLTFDLSKEKTLDGTNTVQQPFVFRTMNDTNPVSVTLTVRAQKKPATVIGLKPDVKRGVVAGRALSLTADDFRYQDQYGNLMSASEVVAAGSYKMAVEYKVNDGTHPAFAGLTGGSGTLATDKKQTLSTLIADKTTPVVPLTAGAAGAVDLSGDITVQLTDNAAVANNIGGSKTFSVYSVPLAKMTSFDVKVPDLVPSADVKDVGSDAATEAEQGLKVKVIGRYAGEEIELVNDGQVNTTVGSEKYQDFKVLDPRDNAGATTGQYAKVPTLKDEKTVVTKKGMVEVVIADAMGTHLKKEFTYSNAARVVKSAEYNGEDVELAAGNNDITWTQIASKFTIKDQYGKTVVVPYVTFSLGDKVTNPTISNAAGEINGTKTAKLTFTATTGKFKVGVKLSFPGSSYTYETEVTIDRK